MAMKVPGGTNSETLLTKPAMVRPNWYSAPKDPDADTKPTWDRWLNMNTVPLWQAVALSCGIEPEHLVDGSDDEYKKRLVIAISHLEPGGWLSHITAHARPHVTLVRLADIRAVADRCVPPWSLPGEFPRGASVQADTVEEVDLDVKGDEAEPLSEPQQTGPKGVTTGDLAFAFSGLKDWGEDRWKSELGKGRGAVKWLSTAIISLGQRGGAETTWNPVTIALHLLDVTEAHAKETQMRIIRARFESKPQLKHWSAVLDELLYYHPEG